MTHELPVASARHEVANYLKTLGHLRAPLFLTEIPGGFQSFTDVVCHGANRNDILARKFDREPNGRGPHFDIYDDLTSPDYPWVGVYNLAGTAAVTATLLPSYTVRAYRSRHQRPTPAAEVAAKYLSAKALEASSSEIFEGTITPNVGMVLPRRADGTNVVRDIVPEDARNPGEYVKVLVSRGEAKGILEDDGYVPLDEFIAASLGIGVNGHPLPDVPHPIRNQVLSKLRHRRRTK